VGLMFRDAALCAAPHHEGLTVVISPRPFSSTSRNCSLPRKFPLPDEEGRRTKRAALDPRIECSDQLCLHVGVLRGRAVWLLHEAGRCEGLGRDFRIVHFLWLDHMW